MPRLNSRATALILAGLCAVGLFLRVWNLGQRPFWRDEAWVAQALRDLSFGQLLRQTDVPLPPLFAVTAKACDLLRLPPEWAWRLLPAFAGFAVVPLSYMAARTLGAPRSIALAGAALCAVSALLVIWSRDLKQYALEAFFSVLIALLIFRLHRSTCARARWRYGVAIAAVALLAPWFAYGAIFPIAALLPLLFLPGSHATHRRRFLTAGLVGAAALAAGFLSMWLVAGRGQASDPALVSYSALWYLPPLDPERWARPLAHVAATVVMLVYPPDWIAPISTLGQLVTFLVLLVLHFGLAILGVLCWPRAGRRELAWWVVAPLLAMTGAAFLGRYPLGVERMMQFWAPPMLVAMAMGAAVLCRFVFGLLAKRSAPALIAVIAFAVLPVVYMVREPLEFAYWIHHDFPAVLKKLAQLRLPGEPVFVELFAVPCVRYYAPDLAPPVVFTPVAAGTLLKPGADPAALARGVAQSAFARCWILGTNEFTNSLDRKELQAIRRQGFEIEVIQRAGHLHSANGAAELLRATRR